MSSRPGPFSVLTGSNITSFLQATKYGRVYAVEKCRMCGTKGRVVDEEFIEVDEGEKAAVSKANGHSRIDTKLNKDPDIDPEKALEGFNPMMLMFGGESSVPAKSQNEVLIQVCSCKKNMKFLHETCLVREINERLANVDTCKHCGEVFKTTRNTSKPLYQWKCLPVIRTGQLCKVLGWLSLGLILGGLVVIVIDALLKADISDLITVPLMILVGLTYLVGIIAALRRSQDTFYRIYVLNCPVVGVKPWKKIDEKDEDKLETYFV